MSDYLNQTSRTEQEAMADIRKDQAKKLKAITDRVINLCKAMKQNDNSQFPLARSRK